MRMVDLVLPRRFLDDLLRQQLRQHPSASRWIGCSLGIAQTVSGTQLLCRSQPRWMLEERPATDHLRLAFGKDPRLLVQEGLTQPGSGGGGHWQAQVVLGTGEAADRLAAVARSPRGDMTPVRCLLLPGARMERLWLRADGSQSNTGWCELPDRWSRSQGALGPGSWQQFTRLSVGIVGVGRLGSRLVGQLAQNGLQQLTLVDPGSVELSDLGEGEGFTERDLGKNKAIALAEALTFQYRWLTVCALPLPVNRWQALAALKECDVLVCAADTDGGRLMTARLAALYHKPLLDVGTAIFQNAGDRRVQGLEIRLIVPGDGCLECWGGVADPEGAEAELRERVREQAALGRTDWREQRAGSLRSLNCMAVGLAMNTLERLVCGELDDSLWTRWTVQGTAQPQLQSLVRRPGPARCLCAWQGRGDAGLSAPNSSKQA